MRLIFTSLRSLLAFCISAVAIMMATAETPTDLRTEKIFLSTDRSRYSANDTVVVDGFVACLAHDNVLPYSRYVYVELINPKVDSVLQRKKLRISGSGNFHSMLDLPEEYPHGEYWLRAYTMLMTNFAQSAFGYHSFGIGEFGSSDHYDFEHSQIINANEGMEARLEGNRVKFQINVKNVLPTGEGLRLFSFDDINGLSEITLHAASGIFRLPNEPVGPMTLFVTDDTLGIVTERTLFPPSRSDLMLEGDDTVPAMTRYEWNLTGITDSIAIATKRFVSNETPNYAGAVRKLTVCGFDSHKFNRFDLKEAVEKDCNLYSVMPENVITVKGIVLDEKYGRFPVKKGKVVGYNSANASVSESPLDNTGHFCLETTDFLDDTEFFIQVIDANDRPMKAKIVLESDTLPGVAYLPTYRSRSKFEREQKGGPAEVSGWTAEDLFRELPEINVQVRKRKPPVADTKVHYGTRMKDRQAIEKKGYVTLLDILNDMPFVKVATNGDGSRGITTTRGRSTLQGDESLPVVIDGSVWDSIALSSALHWPAYQIESVEQLNPAEALKYTFNAMNGAILVRTIDMTPKTMRQSLGTRCRPEGLSSLAVPDNNQRLIAPEKPGEYLLVVDGVTASGRVFSVSKPVTVK